MKSRARFASAALVIVIYAIAQSAARAGAIDPAAPVAFVDNPPARSPLKPRADPRAGGPTSARHIRIARPPSPPPASPAPARSFASQAESGLVAAESGDRFWFGAEQLLWGFSRGRNTPLVESGVSGSSSPIVTLSPAPPHTGFIDIETVTSVPTQTLNNVLAGASGENGLHSGQAVHLGYWLNAEHSSAIEAEGFYFGRIGDDFQTSPGSATLGIPYFDHNAGRMAVYAVSRPMTTVVDTRSVNTTPGVFVRLTTETIAQAAQGVASVSSWSSLFGSQINYRMALPERDDGVRLSLIEGVRYVGFSEAVSIGSAVSASRTDTTIVNPALAIPGSGAPILNNAQTFTQTSDKFAASNNFFGPQLGLSADYRWDRLWVAADARLAAGAMSEAVTTSGATQFAAVNTVTPTKSTLVAFIPIDVASGPAATTTTGGSSASGLFAQRPGSINRLAFALVPSGSFEVGYDLAPGALSLSIGYSFLYLSSVARAADQIDSGAGSIQKSGFLAQGLHAGLDFHF